MAKTKSGGSSTLGRDSLPKYLGLKVGEGQTVKPGMILIRQRGAKYLVGKNVKKGADDTLYALKNGQVHFLTKKIKRFDGSRRLVSVVSVIESGS